ncbi:Hypothetical protein D9617_2g058840 [Elsinoe fawcettii]|nr:Hypothetical protein D9617_2g058840 [Elsinoe fawcettii]
MSVGDMQRWLRASEMHATLCSALRLHPLLKALCEDAHLRPPVFCGEICPPNAYCQQCGSKDIKEFEVDLRNYIEYKVVDLDKTPCIFLPCGDFFTASVLDNHINLSDFYNLDAFTSNPIALYGQSLELEAYYPTFRCPRCSNLIDTITRYAVTNKVQLLLKSTHRVTALAIPPLQHLQQYALSLSTSLTSTSPLHPFSRADYHLSGPLTRITTTITTLFATSTHARYADLLPCLSTSEDQLALLTSRFWTYSSAFTAANAAHGPARFDTASLTHELCAVRLALRCTRVRVLLVVLADYLPIAQGSPRLAAGPRVVDLEQARQEVRAMTDEAVGEGLWGTVVQTGCLLVCMRVKEMGYSEVVGSGGVRGELGKAAELEEGGDTERSRGRGVAHEAYDASARSGDAGVRVDGGRGGEVVGAGSGGDGGEEGGGCHGSRACWNGME